MPASAQGTWTPGPLHPRLADGAAHVWRADLATVPQALGELLSGEERARAARLVNARSGELWRRSRGLLRTLLGRYLGHDPSSLRFALGAHGKPALVCDGEDPLSFNMSHSGSTALYAFSSAGEIGVDVEMALRRIDEVAVAHRTLGRTTAERLAGLDPATRRLEFLRAWARHEATLKCLGLGIGGVGIGESRADVIGEQRADADVPELWVSELELGDLDAAAAVAAERRPRALSCWQWRG
jgi:4'-phosphopantetheinyl transferase